MVEPEAEQARDGLRAEHRRRNKTRVTRGDADSLRRGQQPERAHDLGIELAHRHETCRIGGYGRRLPPGGERVRQLSAGQRVGRPEARRVVSEDRGRRDNPNLGICPRERDLLRGDDGRGRQRLNRPSGTCGEAEGKENRRGQGKSTPHTLCIGHQRAGLSTGRGRRGSRGYIWAHDSPGYPHVPRRRDRLRRRRARGSAAAGTGDGGSDGDGRQGIARSAPRQAGVRQRLVVLVKHVSGRGGCLRALGEAAGRCVPLPRPERG